MQGRDYYARARVEALISTVALVAAAVAGALAFPLASNATVTGSVAPDFVLKATDGRNLRLSEYRGDVVLLAFWASWCGACRATLADLNSLSVGEGAATPVVIGINLDGDAARASSLASTLGLKFPTLVDVGASVGRLYDIDKLPLTVLVDRDGVVRGAWSAQAVPHDELQRQLERIGP